MMLLLGWTLSELAEAKARYTKHTGATPAADITGATDVIVWWEERYNGRPGEVRLITDYVPELDLAWASKTFCKVSSEVLR